MKALPKRCFIDTMKQVGIMGGTFDPPHIGHLILAEAVREALHLDEIRFMPAGQIAHKESADTVCAGHRLEMVKLAIAGNPYFIADDTEVEREGNTYTYVTMEALKEKEPDTAFTFLVGADSLDYMDCWKHPERIFQCCRIAAVVRPGFSVARMEEKKRELEHKYHAEIVLVPALEIPVSSTQVRQKLKEGRSVKYLLPDKVERYIYKQGLYGCNNKG